MKNPDSKMLFGDKGAGVLVMAKSTGRVLAMKRSDNVQQPRTWGIPGGKLEEGEVPEQAALRELYEEIGYDGEAPEIFDLKIYQSSDGGFEYYNHLMLVPDEFSPVMDHESEAFSWVKPDQWPDPPHFGMTVCLDDPQSRHVINEVRESYLPGETSRDWAISQKNYPPTLYHVLHDAPRGEALLPSQANEDDACPYVYATSNPREALPYLTPNGTRLVNAPVPGSEDVLTIIPDREGFLKNGNMGGQLFRFSGEGFEQQYIDGEPTSQWVSKSPVPFDKMQNLGGYDMDSAMASGLQILFPRDDMSFDEVEAIYTAPDFPHNLPGLVEKGDLIHENALRGLKPSAFFNVPGSRAPDAGPSFK